MFPFWARTPPPLQNECRCGNALGRSCNEIGLNNHRNFVPFRDLPDENDIDEDYYTRGEFMYEPRRHWALAGEIAATEFFIRPRATLKTRFGEEVLVNFHLENAAKPKFFDWNLLQKGNTVIIMYPERRTFLDMNQGIRQESPTSVMVFKAGLDKVTKEVEYFKKCSDVPSEEALHLCFVCGAETTQEGTPLKRCARCKRTAYCGRECQISHWKDQHKNLCGQSEMLMKIAAFDFTTFNGFMDWSFQPERNDREALEAKAEKARLEMIRRFTREEPLSKPERFRKVLDGIKDSTFPQIGGRLALELSEDMKQVFESSFCVDMEQTELFQGLFELSQKAIEGDEARAQGPVHVMDMKYPPGISRGDKILFDTVRDRFICHFFLSLAVKQHQEGILNIRWVIDADDCWCKLESGAVLEEGQWQIDDDSCVFIASNQTTRLFCSDTKPLLVGIASQIAQEFQDTLVIRVLRVTTDTMKADEIREIANSPTPPNVYTLWIREEVYMSMGDTSFGELDSNKSIVDQVLDFSQEYDPALSFLRMMGVDESSILYPRSDSSDADESSDSTK